VSSDLPAPRWLSARIEWHYNGALETRLRISTEQVSTRRPDQFGTGELKMPTTIYPRGTFSETSNVSRDRGLPVGAAALLIAGAIILLIVSAAAPSSPEATAMDPFQLLAMF